MFLQNKFNVLLIYCISILIICSTQFVKQHVLIDAVSAILLGNLVFETVYYLAQNNLIARHAVSSISAGNEHNVAIQAVQEVQ